MKSYNEPSVITTLSHEEIMVLVARGRAERSAYICDGLKRGFKALSTWLSSLLPTAAPRLRLRHH